jgi:hypothetical protein
MNGLERFSPNPRFGAASAQERQVREFLDSTTTACLALVKQS